MPNKIDLRPKRADVDVSAGDAWAIEVRIRQPGPDKPPLDLTGYDIAGVIDDGTELKIARLDDEAGHFSYGQDAASSTGWYDIQLTPPGGLPRTRIKGWLDVEKDITP